MADNERFTAPSATPEMLIASVLHLMSHYVVDIDNAGAGTTLSVAIERHFHALSNMAGLPPVLRGTCLQLSQQWGTLVADASARVPARASILRRFQLWAIGPAR
jgi:hypothetical protein